MEVMTLAEKNFLYAREKPRGSLFVYRHADLMLSCRPVKCSLQIFVDLSLRRPHESYWFICGNVKGKSVRPGSLNPSFITMRVLDDMSLARGLEGWLNFGLKMSLQKMSLRICDFIHSLFNFYLQTIATSQDQTRSLFDMYGSPYNQNINPASSPPPLHHPGTFH